ncbi:MAG TPA: outer membrane beta-barrel protein [Candidatus Aminicenantes bacterium]|nr:outer membrane beta-barrel protein [Candidatus Aminicenantes bacterium]
MKRKLLVILAILACVGLLPAAELEVGAMVGLRTMSDSAIKDTYGSGVVFLPHVEFGVAKGFVLGAAYEAGYSKDADIGIYADASTLKVSGFELTAAYRFRLSSPKVVPYLKAGVGFYKFKQEIPSLDIRVDGNKAGLVLAGGVKVHVGRKVFLSGEIKYVPLKVTPLDVEVDLGGLRLMVGIGTTFGG